MIWWKYVTVTLCIPRNPMRYTNIYYLRTSAVDFTRWMRWKPPYFYFHFSWLKACASRDDKFHQIYSWYTTSNAAIQHNRCWYVTVVTWPCDLDFEQYYCTYHGPLGHTIRHYFTHAYPCILSWVELSHDVQLWSLWNWSLSTTRKPPVDALRPLRPAACRATIAPSQPRPLPTVACVATRRPHAASRS